MTAEEYLGQINLMNTILEKRKSELEEMKARAKNIKSFDFQNIKVTGGQLPGNKGIPEAITRILIAEENYMKLIDFVFRLRTEIIEKIQMLKNVLHIKVLYKYYVEEKPLIRISEEIDRSYGYTRQLKSKALEAFGKQHDKFLKRKKVITNEC